MLFVMRSQCCIYVDAGYLLASAATRLTGTSYRSGIRVKYEPLIESLISQVEEVAGVPLLRVNWYDAAKNALPDKDQERIGAMPRVKVRLGRVGYQGEQKGVDLRIGLDMVAQSRNGAFDVVYLLSGDDDLTEAVEEAQIHGVQVIVLAVPDTEGKPNAVSVHLTRASDGIELISPASLDRTVFRAVVKTPSGAMPAPVPGPKPGPPATPVPGPPKPGAVPTPPPHQAVVRRAPESTLAYRSETGGRSSVAPEYAMGEEKIAAAIMAVVIGVIDAFLASATQDEKDDVIRARPSIRSDIDRTLLFDLSHRIDVSELSDRLRYELRDRFWEVLIQKAEG
ncbi:MAG: NYN domain-containing protein [Bifidobacteriaceae bacterium]|jgi:uncharacterized LabA/DUF88 family protein|nr:NYN domain-containing protein [Bifidobacteriaceae bacterium]